MSELMTDPEVFAKGTPVLMLAGPRSTTIEEWVQTLAEKSRLGSRRVDWRLVGGWAILLVLDDAESQNLIRDLAIQSIEQLCDAYMACTSNFSKNPTRDDVQWGVL